MFLKIGFFGFQTWENQISRGCSSYTSILVYFCREYSVEYFYRKKNCIFETLSRYEKEKLTWWICKFSVFYQKNQCFQSNPHSPWYQEIAGIASYNLQKTARQNLLPTKSCDFFKPERFFQLRTPLQAAKVVRSAGPQYKSFSTHYPLS